MRGSEALRFKRDDLPLFCNSQHRKICTDGLRNVARCEMGIMLFGHAGVGMAELGGNDAHRHPAHREMRAMGVAQDVKGDGGRDAGPGACLIQRPLLLRGAPGFSVGAQENQLG